MTPQRPPLDGLKVLDLGTMVTAPLAAMLLGQLGANVTKVEHPAGGDPFRKTTGGEYSPNFIAYNQNKTSVQIDLSKAEGRARLLDLVATTDILIENYRPGVMHRLGLDGDALSNANARLIHCSITGFGSDGPYVDRAAYDTVGIGLSGILHLYLDPARPQVFGPTLSDNATGLYAFGGILAALHARERTGQGQRVELNMLESAIAFIPDAFAYWTQAGTDYGPLSRVASSQCFAWVCADGRAISVHLSVPDKFWTNLLDALQAHATLGVDPRYRSRKERVENYVSLAEELANIVRTKPRLHWEKVFAEHDLPFAPVNTIAEVLDDPQVRHLGTFETVRHPDKGEITGIRNPIRINGIRGPVVAPPTLGERDGQISAPRPDADRLISRSA
ncbi:CaiB/BaiF CoA transferase family protein [Rhodoplanes sp. Z2-YC6860]|uniref:CaiB/BaiF CoA transferase family protein n=1 Tax=Rhodoplanes sp. Z2-YC6860 TaxID=674703 RepID=UPI00078BBE12|nr:CoA transferase [Rhodoplanes sp. Z2-YC6860]AMN41506.1 L-carnitine dehydratase/bile acid-inducible protein F [Rhodoplanes sp. Z2-YC6860]